MTGPCPETLRPLVRLFSFLHLGLASHLFDSEDWSEVTNVWTEVWSQWRSEVEGTERLQR